MIGQEIAVWKRDDTVLRLPGVLGKRSLVTKDDRISLEVNDIVRQSSTARPVILRVVEATHYKGDGGLGGHYEADLIPLEDAQGSRSESGPAFYGTVIAPQFGSGKQRFDISPRIKITSDLSSTLARIERAAADLLSEEDREQVLSCLNNVRRDPEVGSYLRLMGYLADHMQVLSPAVPGLAAVMQRVVDSI